MFLRYSPPAGYLLGLSPSNAGLVKSPPSDNSADVPTSTARENSIHASQEQCRGGGVVGIGKEGGEGGYVVSVQYGTGYNTVTAGYNRLRVVRGR